MPVQQLDELTRHSRVQSLPAGTCLYREGDSERKTLYLIEGRIALTSRAHGEEQVVEGGSPESKYPLAREIPRRNSATAVTPVQMLCVDSDTLETLLAWGQIACPETEVIMSQDGILTIDKRSWLNKMLLSATFNKLPPANIEELLDRLEPIKVNGGDVIIRQGDTGDYFYMINEGIALVSRELDEAGDAMEVAELKEGDSFGESALISNKPRNATITMMTDGVLLRLSKGDFRTLLQEPTLQWLDFEEAQELIGQGARWVDVRMPNEFVHAHLMNATNIPMQDLHKHSTELDPAPTYVCYCDSGRRSSAAAFVLSQYGFKTCVLKNGIQSVPEGQLTGE